MVSRILKIIGSILGVLVVLSTVVNFFLSQETEEGSEMLAVGQQLIATIDKTQNSATKLLEILEGVVDEASASDAAVQVGQAFSTHHQNVQRMIELSIQAQEMGNVRMNKTQAEQLEQQKNQIQQKSIQVGSLGDRITGQKERISQLDGLPIEFWEVHIPAMSRGVKMIGAWPAQAQEHLGISAQEIEENTRAVELYEKYGFRKTAYLELEGVSENQVPQIAAEIRKVVGNEPEISHWYDSQLRLGKMLVAPVENLADLKPALPLTFGVLEAREKRAMSAGIGVMPGAESLFANAEARAFTDPPQIGSEEQFAAEIPPALKERFGDDFSPSKMLQQLPKTPAEAEKFAREMQSLAEQASEGSPLASPEIPARDDPDSIKRLAELMEEESNPALREDVIDRLLKIDRSEIEDKEVAKQIARNFRKMAYEQGSLIDQTKIVKGLVKYAGKYSVPVLIDIMSNEKLEIDNEVFFALSQFPSRQSADAAAKFLGNFFNHQQAVACLRRMGSAAEQTLIDVAPSNDPKVSLAAVELLGEVGTEKSLPLLRKAIKSRNTQIEQAAKASIRKIRTRGEASK